jgi:hypothetical protein
MLIKPMTITQLSKAYNVCVPTMKKWIHELNDEIGKKNGRIFSIKQVKIIFELLGSPYEKIEN